MATVPTISSVVSNDAGQLVLTWTVPQTTVRNYKIYRDLSAIGVSVGKSNNTYTDTGVSYGAGVEYSYNVSVVDYDDTEGSLSDTFSKDFEESDLILDKMYNYFVTLGAQNMILVVDDQEIPWRTAMETYIDDVIIALDNGIVFDTQFREGLSDNIKSFWYIPQADLWAGTGLSGARKNRAFFGDTKINNKVSNIMARLYSDARYFYDG